MIYIVESKTKWHNIRFTGVSDEVDDLVEYFRDWTVHRKLKPKQIWYANVYRVVGDKAPGPDNTTLIGFFELTDDGNVIMDIDLNGKEIDVKKKWLRRFGLD